MPVTPPSIEVVDGDGQQALDGDAVGGQRHVDALGADMVFAGIVGGAEDADRAAVLEYPARPRGDHREGAVVVDLVPVAAGAVAVHHLGDVGADQPPAVPEGRLVLDVDQQQVRSEEHTSELQSLMRISYAVFCLKKKKKAN